jgi:hypothetical protein
LPDLFHHLRVDRPVLPLEVCEQPGEALMLIPVHAANFLNDRILAHGAPPGGLEELGGRTTEKAACSTSTQLPPQLLLGEKIATVCFLNGRQESSLGLRAQRKGLSILRLQDRHDHALGTSILPFTTVPVVTRMD